MSVRQPPGSGADEGKGAADGVEIRCICRNLVARRRGTELELRCRRCKRSVVVDFTDENEIEVKFR